MAAFDIKTFIAAKGGGSDIVGATGSAFGMPSCLTKLTKDALEALPTELLYKIGGEASDSKSKADEDVSKAFRQYLLESGVMEITTAAGVIKYISDSSENGLDEDEGGALNSFGAFLGAADTALNAGTQLYSNMQMIKQDVENIVGCVEKYNDILKFSGGSAANERVKLAKTDPSAAAAIVEGKFAANKAGVQGATQFIDDANALIENISTIISERANNPDLEPRFLNASAVSGTNLLTASDAGEVTELIRLLFGPPKSKTGNFLLSIDGLYYDSQTSAGIQPVLSFLGEKETLIKPSEKWKFNHAPNLGGRGDAINIKEINNYVGTIFDPESIDESKELQKYYDADHMIQVLKGEKNKAIYDLSAHVAKLTLSGASEAIIYNTKQAIHAKSNTHYEKMRKRMKQIEVAIKTSDMFGGGKVTFTPGNVPINDFSYLQRLNLPVDIKKQRKLVLDQGEVSSVVLPLTPKFSITPGGPNISYMEHLLIPEVGKGSIYFDDPDAIGTSSTELSITDVVTTDGLFAIYNFLETDTGIPSVETYQVKNCATEDSTNDAKLVSLSAQDTYFSGMGIPMLRGITRPDSTDVTKTSSIGSYVKMPDTSEFQDLMYNKSGCTIESWVYMPNLSSINNGWADNGTSSLYRLILANENFGIASGIAAQPNLSSLNPDFSDGIVRGFMMGFTRDRRITQNQAPSNLSALNSPTSSLSFFLAPTQSVNASGIGFVGKKVGDECVSSTVYHSLQIPTSSVGAGSVKFDDMCAGFSLLTLTIDPINDTVSVYLDANLMSSSSINSVFGTLAYRPPRLPSFKKNNSFDYSGISGPGIGKFFTPWVVGGGYTDGASAIGNFMGSSIGGRISGLRGHIGSLKFYKKPLNPTQILNNFKGQRNFFKNILTDTNCANQTYIGPNGGQGVVIQE